MLVAPQNTQSHAPLCWSACHGVKLFSTAERHSLISLAGHSWFGAYCIGGRAQLSSTLLYMLRNAWQLAQHTGVCCAAGGAAAPWGTGVMKPPRGMPSLLAP